MVDVYDDLVGGRRVGRVKANPVCGVHFCDYCGDCLACYGDDYCPGGLHSWVWYTEDGPLFGEPQEGESHQ